MPLPAPVLIIEAFFRFMNSPSRNRPMAATGDCPPISGHVKDGAVTGPGRQERWPGRAARHVETPSVST